MRNGPLTSLLSGVRAGSRRSAGGALPQSRDEMGPLLLVACATIALIRVAGLLKPDREVPLSIIAAMLGAVLFASFLVRTIGLRRRDQELERIRDAEQFAEMARAERLLSITKELRREETESAIHRLLMAQACLVVAHDESDLVVFPRGAQLAPAREARTADGLGIEPSALEQRVAETGAAAHRTTLERGRPCYQVAVPVLTTDGLLAVLTLRRALGSFTVAELDAAMALCSQVGIALERARPSPQGDKLLS
jgi:hypothetical protein